MSKTRIAIAVAVLTILLSSSASAGLHIRVGGPLGVARFAVARVLSLGGLHRARAYARYGHTRTAALRPQEVRAALEPGPANPVVRRQVAAAAALATWQGGRNANGWWRHTDGGYGWVGPLFWPFAIYDVYDYAIWGDGLGLWDYGYRDIQAAIFSPYGRDELAAFTGPRPSGRRHRRNVASIELCGDDSREMAALPADQLLRAMQLSNEAQRAALDDLANAMATASQIIRASCPAQPALTAPERLAVMQQRLEAMIKARYLVEPPLGKFYDLLDDDQEARLNAVAADRRKASAANIGIDAAAQGCGAALPWPTDEIAARLHPNATQRAALRALQEASATAAGILAAHCQPLDATTPPARLDAVQGRLEAMMQAVGVVSAALKEFYATLSDEQKAQFETIGQKRTA